MLPVDFESIWYRFAGGNEILWQHTHVKHERSTLTRMSNVSIRTDKDKLLLAINWILDWIIHLKRRLTSGKGEI